MKRGSSLARMKHGLSPAGKINLAGKIRLAPLALALLLGLQVPGLGAEAGTASTLPVAPASPVAPGSPPALPGMPAIPPAPAVDPARSVVQIITFQQSPMWDAPWKWEPVARSSGSGFLVADEGGRVGVMTNAHVVSWARQIVVKRHQDPRNFLARVRFIGHDCDLALLEVADSSFFEGLHPLPVGDLPRVQSTVFTFGYPAGGKQISYTRGVVSRIEMRSYAHVGNRSFLSVQTDAAINPGNSGGPVLQGGKVVGVAFQGAQGLENTGFFIPPSVVRHFLLDIGDGRYHGFPDAGIKVASLENPAYRRSLGLASPSASALSGEGLGVRVDEILPGTPAEGVLEPDDVILRVGSYEVGQDGTILYGGNRVQMGVAFDSMQQGEKIGLRIVRDRRIREVKVPMAVYREDLAQGNQYDTPPRYYVRGGLVFAPLSLDLLKAKAEGGDKAGKEFTYELFYARAENPKEAREEPVALIAVLPHAVNANFTVDTPALLDRIGSRRIERLEDVVEALEGGGKGKGAGAGAGSGSRSGSGNRKGAPEAKGAEGGLQVLQFLPKGHIETLDLKAVEAAQEEILKTYGVPHDRRL